MATMGSVVLGFPGGDPRPDRPQPADRRRADRPHADRPHADRPHLPRPLLRTTIGDVLRRTRRAQRRTLADVAEQAKVSLPYLSELERGLKEASSEVLAAVCDALGIELSELLVRAGRDLFREAARREQVIRLDAIAARRAGPPAGGAGHLPAAPTMLAA
jgi:transcriptional regulator with XRE-family HTH domain